MVLALASVASAARITARFVRVNAGALYTRYTLDPPACALPIVLIHGLVISTRYMVPLLEALAPLQCAYAPDLPGYGKSYKPATLPTLPGLAAAIGEWMDAMGMARAHLVGNSFGCQVIAQFAVDYPERIGRLVLQGPTVDAAARTLPRQLYRLALNSVREPRPMGKISFHDYSAAGIRRAWATVRIALSDRIEDKLPRIEAPTLVVRGERDPLVPQAWAERVCALLRHGELVVMPGLPHTINYGAPDRLVQVMRPFLHF
jgi:2-hydroxy-6-oxonona-2,4-dienedioate hydrolase